MTKDYDLMHQVYNRLDLINVRCDEKRMRRLIFFLLTFIRVSTLVGKGEVFVCRMESLVGVIDGCQDSNIYKLVLAVIMNSIDFEEGALCLTGSASSLYQFIETTPFGLNDWDLLSLFAIWADQMSGIMEDDKLAMCAMSDRMMKNRAKWDIQLKQYYCWFAKSIRCSGMSDAELDGLFESKECREFLSETEKKIRSPGQP
jgi:hypothetical protein